MPIRKIDGLVIRVTIVYVGLELGLRLGEECVRRIGDRVTGWARSVYARVRVTVGLGLWYECICRIRVGVTVGLGL